MGVRYEPVDHLGNHISAFTCKKTQSWKQLLGNNLEHGKG